MEVTSQQGVTINVIIQGFMRVPRECGGDLVKLLTPFGVIDLEGSELSFESVRTTMPFLYTADTSW